MATKCHKIRPRDVNQVEALIINSIYIYYINICVCTGYINIIRERDMYDTSIKFMRKILLALELGEGRGREETECIIRHFI